MLRIADFAVRRPCSADWDEMPDHGRYRLCARCNERVYDFARHTEREIVALAARGVCRRVGVYEDGTIVTRESTGGPSALLPAARLARFVRAAALAVPLAACDRPQAGEQAPLVEAASARLPTTAPSASGAATQAIPPTAATGPEPVGAEALPAAFPSATAAVVASGAPSCRPPTGTAAPPQTRTPRKAGKPVARWDLGSQR